MGQWPTRKLQLLWSLCSYQQNLYIILIFHHLLTYWFCKPSYTVSTWIVRNKFELELETWNNLKQHAKYFTIILFLNYLPPQLNLLLWPWRIIWTVKVENRLLWVSVRIFPLRAIYYSRPYLNNSKETFIREFWNFLM